MGRTLSIKDIRVWDGATTPFRDPGLLGLERRGSWNIPVIERWYVLVVMSLVYAINIGDRYVVSTVLEQIRLDLKLTDSGVAFLTGTPLALFYVTFGIPVSWLADRSNRRNIIAGALVIWSGFTALCGFSTTYWQFLLSRIGVGVGEAGGTPPSTAIVSDYFPAERRPMAITVLALGAPLGAWLGAVVAGRIAADFGWRSAFLALGFPGLAIGLLVYWTIKEPQRGCLDSVGRVGRASLSESMRFCWEQKAAFHIIVGNGVATLWGWGLIYWTPVFLQRMYGLNVGDAGAVTGNIHLVGGSLATILTAWLLSRRYMADPRRVVWALAAGFVLATVPSFLAYWTHELWLCKLMLAVFIPGIYFFIGPFFALLNNLAPCQMRNMFVAISLLVANVANLVIAPWAVGTLSDWFASRHGIHGGDASSLRAALLWLAPTGLWAAFHMVRAARTIVTDQERAAGYASPPTDLAYV